MEFNPDKCKVLRITNKRKIITNNYIMHGQILELVHSAEYLGVFFHKKLSWNTHINYTAIKGNQVRCFVQRNLRTCHRNIKLQSYKTYVRPILEYGQQHGILTLLQTLLNWKWSKERLLDSYLKTWVTQVALPPYSIISTSKLYTKDEWR